MKYEEKIYIQVKRLTHHLTLSKDTLSPERCAAKPSSNAKSTILKTSEKTQRKLLYRPILETSH